MIKMILFTYSCNLIVLFKNLIADYSKITVKLKEIHSFFSFFNYLLHLCFEELKTYLLRHHALVEQDILPSTVDVWDPVFVVDVVHERLNHRAHHSAIHLHAIESLSSAFLQDQIP